MDESFDDFDDLKMMSESDIRDLSRDFGKHSGARRITFGLRRTKRLKLVLHWAQDYYRCSEMPDLKELDQDSFLAALTVADCGGESAGSKFRSREIRAAQSRSVSGQARR